MHSALSWRKKAEPNRILFLDFHKVDGMMRFIRPDNRSAFITRSYMLR